MNALARCFLTFGLATALASVPLTASADDPQPPSPLPAGGPSGCPLTGVEPFIDFVLERTGVGAMELDCQGAQATPTPSPAATPTPPPAATATPAPTATPTEAPDVASPTPLPTVSPPATASASPTASPTATASPSPSPSPTVLGEERPPAEAPRVSAQLAQLPSTSTEGGR